MGPIVDRSLERLSQSDPLLSVSLNCFCVSPCTWVSARNQRRQVMFISKLWAVVVELDKNMPFEEGAEF